MAQTFSWPWANFLLCEAFWLLLHGIIYFAAHVCCMSLKWKKDWKTWQYDPSIEQLIFPLYNCVVSLWQYVMFTGSSSYTSSEYIRRKYLASFTANMTAGSKSMVAFPTPNQNRFWGGGRKRKSWGLDAWRWEMENNTGLGGVNFAFF